MKVITTTPSPISLSPPLSQQQHTLFSAYHTTDSLTHSQTFFLIPYLKYIVITDTAKDSRSPRFPFYSSHHSHSLTYRSFTHTLVVPNTPIARLRVATEGGFEALMMISMVRSVDLQTKLLCVIALCNLLDDCTVEYILNEGLVGSVANLSKISDSDTTHLCATLMNQLTYYLPARLNIAEKVSIFIVDRLCYTSSLT